MLSVLPLWTAVTDERSSDSGGVKSAAEVADLARDRTLAGAGESEEQAAVGTKPEESAAPTDRPTSSTERPTPPSPMMDLETDFPPGEARMLWSHELKISHLTLVSVCCRIVGAEASCSSARGEEAQRRLLWQETGMMALMLFSNLGRFTHRTKSKEICVW